jgi:hypothetical protein
MISVLNPIMDGGRSLPGHDLRFGIHNFPLKKPGYLCVIIGSYSYGTREKEY